MILDMNYYVHLKKLKNKGEIKMIEKVNPSHPDKVADRIAGAIVDIAYKLDENPKIAVEVLIGHGVCHIIAESSVEISHEDARKVVHRITSDLSLIHI